VERRRNRAKLHVNNVSRRFSSKGKRSFWGESREFRRLQQITRGVVRFELISSASSVRKEKKGGKATLCSRAVPGESDSASNSGKD